MNFQNHIPNFKFLVIIAITALGPKTWADSTAVAEPATTEVKMSAPLPEKPKGSVTFKVFAEWYDDFSKGTDKESGFDMTRAYLGYKYDFTEYLSSTVILDAGRSNEIVSAVYDTTARRVNTTTDARYKAFLKIASVKYVELVPRTTLEAGLVGSNQFSTQEKFWGYRYVYKSLMDQNGYGAAADLGAKVNVKLSDVLGLSVEALNGDGFTKPQDVHGFYKLSGALDLKLPMGLSGYGYYDWSPQRGLEAQSNIAGFLGYEMKEMFRVGAELDYQIANKGVDSNDLTGISAYAAYYVTKQLEVFARFDLLQSKDDWNIAGTDGQTLIGGIQYTPAKGFKLAADYQGFTPAASGTDPQPKFKVNLEFSL